MAGPKQHRPDDKGKVRVRFMEVEIEGSNETLLEGIRNITAAMPSQTVIVQKQVPALRAARQLTESIPSDAGGEPETEPDDREEVLAEEDPPSEEASPRPNRSPRRPPKAPRLSTNLRLNEEPTPLRAFCESTKVTKSSSIMDQTIVIATWLKEHRQTDSMSAGDLFTCCKEMDWSPPTDATSPMRNLKKAHKMNLNNGKYSLTIVGDKRFRELRK